MLDYLYLKFVKTSQKQHMILASLVNSLWVIPLHVEREYYLACACEELYCPPTAYFSLYGLTVQASFLGEFKFLNCNACISTQWTNDVDDYDGLDKSPAKKKIGGGILYRDVDDYNASNTPFHVIKFILLFGLFKFWRRSTAMALLAARNSSAVVFIGTFGALAFGDTDLPVDDIAAVCLLVYFGVSTLLDANSGDGLKAEEEQKVATIRLCVKKSFFSLNFLISAKEAVGIIEP
ncbi:hypothetical protein LOK49_LG09G01738, partial [Camellia lanceoleosa]